MAQRGRPSTKGRGNRGRRVSRARGATSGGSQEMDFGDGSGDVQSESQRAVRARRGRGRGRLIPEENSEQRQLAHDKQLQVLF